MNYKLAELNYSYDALEPHIDKETMEIHHSKHHRKYVDKFNEAVKGTIWEGKEPEDIFPEISSVEKSIATNAGQVYNHNLFWESMTPDSPGKPDEPLAEAINKYFGSFNDFQEEFSGAAATQFGSGWAWLIKDGDKLVISSTSNHINPLMDIAEIKGFPLFCIDVWEHAYYLKYKNMRPVFIEAFWNIVNWDEINRRYKQA